MQDQKQLKHDDMRIAGNKKLYASVETRDLLRSFNKGKAQSNRIVDWLKDDISWDLIAKLTPEQYEARRDEIYQWMNKHYVRGRFIG